MKQLLAGLALVSALHAHAGVVYRWQDITTNPGLGNVTGFLEIDYASWHAGGTLSGYGRFHPIPGVTSSAQIPGITRLVFGGDGLPEFTWVNDTHSFSQGDISIVMGSLLSGSMAIGDHQSMFSMSSSGSVWTIASFGTDYPSACYFGGVCSGGTGLWVLDLASLPLPEPGSYGLVLLGLASLFATKVRALRRGLKPQE